MYTFKDEGTGETNEYDEEYYKHTLALTINGDVVFEESVTKLYNPETKGDVYITDIDKSDNVMDILLQCMTGSIFQSMMFCITASTGMGNL